MNPDTATLDEIRDWFAERDGWILEPGVEGDPVWCKREAIDKWLPHCEDHPEGAQYEHPYPPTIDGAAAALPEGYRLTLGEYSDGWYASARHNSAPGKSIAKTEQENDEITARYRLAALAAMAMDAKENT